jgi:hypothetical protein
MNISYITGTLPPTGHLKPNLKRPGSLSEGSVPVIFISMVSIHQIDHKTLAIGPIVLELEE